MAEDALDLRVRNRKSGGGSLCRGIGKLFPHLWEVQETATARMKQLMEELLAADPAPGEHPRQCQLLISSAVTISSACAFSAFMWPSEPTRGRNRSNKRRKGAGKMTELTYTKAGDYLIPD